MHLPKLLSYLGSILLCVKSGFAAAVPLDARSDARNASDYSGSLLFESGGVSLLHLTAGDDETRLVERTNPGLSYIPQNSPNYDLVRRAVDTDVREMLRRVLKNWDSMSAIRRHYFPASDDNMVKSVFLAMMPDQRGPRGLPVAHPEYSAVMGGVRLGADFTQPVCTTVQSLAVSTNYDDSAPGISFPDDPSVGIARPYVWTNLCPGAFNVNRRAMRLSDRQCNDFLGPTTRTYHLHWKMDSLATTLLHEFAHFIPLQSGLPWKPREDNRRNPDVYQKVQDFYHQWVPTLRCPNVEPNMCKHNADSYAWYATHVYWAQQCYPQLTRMDQASRDYGRCRGDFLPPWRDTAPGNDATGQAVDTFWTSYPSMDPMQLLPYWP